MTQQPRPMELADYIRELTEHHSHAEHYQVRRGQTWYGQNHVTKVPPLIAQLWANDVPSSASEEGARSAYASRPAARLDALDAAVRIDLEASRWVKDLGEDDPADTIECIRRLHGLLASAARCERRGPTWREGKIVCCTWHSAVHGVRQWWLQARIVTGWDSAAWTPDATCPQCGERGALKVRLTDQIAMCTNDQCRVVWDQTTIGLLADHIRAESNAEKAPKVGPGPCWCPWPKPVVPDLSRLCPRCGSARCRHAVHARFVDTVREATVGRIGA